MESILINCFDLMAESGLCWHSLFALLGHSSVSAIDFSVDWAVSESRGEDAVVGIGQDRGQGNKTGSLWPKKVKKIICRTLVIGLFWQFLHSEVSQYLSNIWDSSLENSCFKSGNSSGKVSTMLGWTVRMRRSSGARKSCDPEIIEWLLKIMLEMKKKSGINPFATSCFH